MERRLIYEVKKEEEGQKLERILRGSLHLRAKEISRAKFREQGICVNGEQRKVNVTVCAGDRVEVLLETKEEASAQLVDGEGSLQILYEDNDLLVVNKPAGLVVHPTGAYYADTLANRLAAYLREKNEDSVIRILGRLDKDTSGVVLAVKNRAAGARLERQREKGQLIKTYLAITEGIPESLSGWIRTPIGPDPERKGRMCVCPKGCGLEEELSVELQKSREIKSAATWYEVLQQQENRALVRLQLQTGRTHQIRVHMASIGCPLVGDSFYGLQVTEKKGSVCSDEIPCAGRMALHAVSLEFVQPFTGERVFVEAPLDLEMKGLLPGGLDFAL